MTSSASKQSNSKSTLQRLHKNMEINMSTLSTAQKQMCIRLLADSNINFAQGKDGFQAELRIDPLKLTSQFCAEKETQPNISPIKKRLPTANDAKKIKQRQNITPKKQNIASKKNKTEKPILKKEENKPLRLHPIYTTSRKLLSKTVKLNSLSILQNLHPQIQLYVYPKKMSFQSLIDLIQEIYDFYWRQQINGEKTKTKQSRVGFAKEVMPSTKNHYVDQKDSKRKNLSKNNRDITFDTKQISSVSANNVVQKKGFCEWVYEKFILSQKQKMKIQQLLVNFVQSLNHFSYKHLGIQMFYNFLAGIYQLDALNYFLVIRTLLQQIYEQKIIQKISNYGAKAGVMYRMKLNPYEKFIEQEKVFDFLQVCCCAKDNKPVREDQYVNKIFEQMTEHMFFEEKKKKNFIHFHEMTQILMRQFLKVQTVNTTNLQLSYTQQNSTLNDFMFTSQQKMMLQSYHPEQELQLTFQVKEQIRQKPQQNDLQAYLPNDTFDELQIEPNSLEQDFQERLFRQIVVKFIQIRKSFPLMEESQFQDCQSKQILQNLYQSIVKSDKKKWVQFIKRKNGSVKRQSQELLFVQKLQMDYIGLRNSNIISNEFIKKILTASYFRQAIIREAGIVF